MLNMHVVFVRSRFRVLGALPSDEELDAYLEAYFGDRLSEDQRALVLSKAHASRDGKTSGDFLGDFASFIKNFLGIDSNLPTTESPHEAVLDEASNVAALLERSTEEMDSVVGGLDGRYIKPKPGGGKVLLAGCCWCFDASLSDSEFLTACILIHFRSSLRSASRWSKRSSHWEKYSCPGSLSNAQR